MPDICGKVKCKNTRVRGLCVCAEHSDVGGLVLLVESLWRRIDDAGVLEIEARQDAEAERLANEIMRRLLAVNGDLFCDH